MSGRHPRAEIARRVHDPAAEVVRHKTTHQHARTSGCFPFVSPMRVRRAGGPRKPDGTVSGLKAPMPAPDRYW